MDTAQTPKGLYIHWCGPCSIHNFESQTDASQTYVIAAHDRINEGALDYFALGDWHGQVSVGQRVHYSFCL